LWHPPCFSTRRSSDLVQPQQAVVYTHTHQLIANGLVQQCRRHGRIYPARQAQNNVVVTNLRTDLLAGFRYVVGHVPVALAAADIAHETMQNGGALYGMGNLGMELQPVKMT